MAVLPSIFAQALPHLPQFPGSDLISTQASSHLLRPPKHWNPHLPASHRAEALLGASQVVPQAPQFCTSFVRSTHEPSQEVMAPQALAHTPYWQTSSALQP
jgi:hypothetical protein